MKELQLAVGYIKRPFAEQVRAQGIRVPRGVVAELKQLESDADAITRLSLRKLITSAQATAARKRLMNKAARLLFVAADAEGKSDG